MSIELLKEWMSAKDNRVRDSHAQLNGVRVKKDEKFPNGLMYPADPNGAPAEVYNCRCTMVAITKHASQATRTENTVESYKEWLKEKKEAKAAAKEDAESNLQKGNDDANIKVARKDIAKIADTLNDKDAASFVEIINQDEDVSRLYKEYGNEVTIYRDKDGFYDPQDSSVHYKLCAQGNDQRPKYHVLAHEMGHYFDASVNWENLKFIGVEKINDSIAFDWLDYKASTSDEFIKAVKADKKAFKKILDNERKKGKLLFNSIPETLFELIEDDASCGVQDAISGWFCNKEIEKWGHKTGYWNRAYNTLAKFMDVKSIPRLKDDLRMYEVTNETWANVMSAVTNGGDELEYCKQYLPNSVATLKKIIGGIK